MRSSTSCFMCNTIWSCASSSLKTKCKAFTKCKALNSLKTNGGQAGNNVFFAVIVIVIFYQENIILENLENLQECLILFSPKLHVFQLPKGIWGTLGDGFIFFSPKNMDDSTPLYHLSKKTIPIVSMVSPIFALFPALNTPHMPSRINTLLLHSRWILFASLQVRQLASACSMQRLHVGKRRCILVLQKTNRHQALNGELWLKKDLHASTLPWSRCRRLKWRRLMDGGSTMLGKHGS